MSVLRIAVPGELVRFMDLGPCRPITRIHPHDARPVNTGWAMVPVLSAGQDAFRTPAENARRLRRAERERAATRERQRIRTIARRTDPEACRSRQEVKA